LRGGISARSSAPPSRPLEHRRRACALVASGDAEAPGSGGIDRAGLPTQKTHLGHPAGGVTGLLRQRHSKGTPSYGRQMAYATIFDPACGSGTVLVRVSVAVHVRANPLPFGPGSTFATVPSSCHAFWLYPTGTKLATRRLRANCAMARHISRTQLVCPSPQ
jgi:hypothetical protein